MTAFLDWQNPAMPSHTPSSPSLSSSPLPDAAPDASAAPVAADATPVPADGYAGDVTPRLAAAWVAAGAAVLVDVRTDAEREWVGYVPGALPLAWKQWPGMAINADFDTGLQGAVPVGGKVVLLCRSGVRSIAAARRAAELGIEAYNILEGFEGNPDAQGRRGRTGGWRFCGLPWKQN